MIRRLTCVMGLALILTGCFGPLTERMDHTNGKIDNTNSQLTDTQTYIRQTLDAILELHYDQKMGGTVEIFGQESQEFIRLRSILIFLETGKLIETIWQYVGAPRPLLSKLGPIVEYSHTDPESGQKLFSFRNVSYVSGKIIRHEIRHPQLGILYRKVIKPVDKVFQELLALTVEDAVEQVMLFQQIAETDEDLAKNVDRAKRVLSVGTTVYGAARLEGSEEGRGISSEDLEKAQAENRFVQQKDERIWYANYLKLMLETCGLEEDLPTLAYLVKARMGLEDDEWSHPGS